MRTYRMVRWLARAVLWLASGIGSLAYVIGLVLFGRMNSARWDRWLAHARGEDVVEDRRTAEPVPVPEDAVVYAGKPMAMARVPIRSENRDARREVHALAERIAGKPLSWKAAKKLVQARVRAGAL